MKLTEEYFLNMGWKKTEDYAYNIFTNENFVIKHGLKHDTYNLYTDPFSSCSIPIKDMEHMIEVFETISKINFKKSNDIRHQAKVLKMFARDCKNLLKK